MNYEIRRRFGNVGRFTLRVGLMVGMLVVFSLVYSQMAVLTAYAQQVTVTVSETVIVPNTVNITNTVMITNIEAVEVQFNNVYTKDVIVSNNHYLFSADTNVSGMTVTVPVSATILTDAGNIVTISTNPGLTVTTRITLTIILMDSVLVTDTIDVIDTLFVTETFTVTDTVIVPDTIRTITNTVTITQVNTITGTVTTDQIITQTTTLSETIIVTNTVNVTNTVTLTDVTFFQGLQSGQTIIRQSPHTHTYQEDDTTYIYTVYHTHTDTNYIPQPVQGPNVVTNSVTVTSTAVVTEVTTTFTNTVMVTRLVPTPLPTATNTPVPTPIGIPLAVSSNLNGVTTTNILPLLIVTLIITMGSIVAWIRFGRNPICSTQCSKNIQG